MNLERKFLLDTNVFIEAYRRYYAFDIAPSFWNSLTQFAKNGKLVSIDRVKDELTKNGKDDELCKWGLSEFSRWFMPTDNLDVMQSYSRIIQWVQEQEQFQEHAKSEFASVADSWLIAYALAYNHTIVTHEVYNQYTKNRVLIPNVCREFDIPYINTFQMLRSLKIQVTV